ncbi:GNAT family N-acetyltransferase [Burkholderia cepacia]|uniref:GNAT family N-acetyltransferase n=1 Tax=Burkholderia cepacia TaxID=292 RepID=UPI0012D91E01|nr:GNAT family N-acetyltransferase [Burkholderia cepacia]
MQNTTKARVFRTALQAPFQLHLSPTELATEELELREPERHQLAVYVEPPNARGLNQIIPMLRRRVRADKKRYPAGDGYTPLAGNGLHAARQTLSKSRDTKAGYEPHPEFVAQVQYRLIVTDHLDPIGYCTFCIAISDWHDVEIDIDEVWLDRRYRSQGIGQAMADKVARIALSTMRELDTRVSEHCTKKLKLDVLVGGDVYSESGASFVRCASSALSFGATFMTWDALKFSRFQWEPRW